MVMILSAEIAGARPTPAPNAVAGRPDATGKNLAVNALLRLRHPVITLEITPATLKSPRVVQRQSRQGASHSLQLVRTLRHFPARARMSHRPCPVVHTAVSLRFGSLVMDIG
jgi:hypothetical protein